MVPRQALLALVGAALAAGCHAGAGGHLARNDAVGVARQPALEVAQLVEQHNRNAELVRSLEAFPDVSTSSRHFGASPRARMALERPRNFSFVLEGLSGTKYADIGSNDELFWFYTKQSKHREIYVCRYDENGGAPPELTIQPEWIIEALGLRMIAPDEARRIEPRRGQQPGTLVLTHRRVDGRGRGLPKQTVVDAQTGRVLQHAFFVADRPKPVALATATDYKAVRLPAEDGGGTAILPGKVQLKLVTPDPRDTLDLTLVLGSTVKVNSPFSDEQRAALFEVPKIPGVEEVNLNERLGHPGGRPAYVHQTRPAPPTSEVSPARLGEPEPIGVDGASLQRNDAMPLEADLPPPPAGPEAIVGARLPSAPEPGVGR